MIPDAANSALLTDLYQLTMIQGYLEHGFDETAVFELFVRKLPPGRNFLVAAGLAQFLDYVENLRFAPDDLEYLAKSGFRRTLVDFLRSFRFTGDVHATERAELKTNCRVVGDIRAPRILIADGASFKGNVDMEA